MKKLTKLHKKILRVLKQLNQMEYLHHFGPKKYDLLQHIFALLVMQACKMSLRRVENNSPGVFCVVQKQKENPNYLMEFFADRNEQFIVGNCCG